MAKRSNDNEGTASPSKSSRITRSSVPYVADASSMPTTPTSNMPPGSASNMLAASTSDMPGPSVSYMSAASTCEHSMPAASTSNMPGPSIGYMLGPSTSSMPGPSISNMRGPLISNMPGPSISNMPGPSIGYIPAVSTSNMPGAPPSYGMIPTASASYMPASSTSNMPGAPSSYIPTASASYMPATSTSASVFRNCLGLPANHHHDIHCPIIAKIKETSATISAFIKVDGDILNKYKIRMEMGPLPKPPIGSIQCPRVRSPMSADPDDGECMQYGAWITKMTLLLKLYHLWNVTRPDYFRLPRDNEICSQVKVTFPAIDTARADEERMRNTAVAFIHSHVLNELESNLYPNYNQCLMAGDPAGLLAVIEDAYIAYH